MSDFKRQKCSNDLPKTLRVLEPLLILGYKVVGNLSNLEKQTFSYDSEFCIPRSGGQDYKRLSTKPELVLVLNSNLNSKTMYLAFDLIDFKKVGKCYSPLVDCDKWNRIMHHLDQFESLHASQKIVELGNGFELGSKFDLHIGTCTSWDFYRFR